MYLDRGLTSDAVDQFRRATAISPKWGEASLLLGLAYEAQGKHDDAGRALAAAARARADSVAIGYARVQHAVTSGVEEEISRALLDFRDRHDPVVRPSAPQTQTTPFVRLGLLRESPGVAPVFAPVLYAEGFRLLSGRRYSEAVAAFQRALETDGNSPDERARLALAESLIASGDVERAERALKETVVALPDSGLAYYRLARLFQSQARTTESLAAFTASSQRAVVIGLDSLYETIAALRVADGDFAGAIAASRLELQANPNNAAAHRRLGDLYAQYGRLGESLADVRGVARDRSSRRRRACLARAGPASPVAICRSRSRRANRRRARSPIMRPLRYALGTALMRTERTEEGLSVLQEFERLRMAARARTDAAWQIKLLTDQAREHAARQEYAAAADLLRRAATHAPADGSIPLAAGALLMKAGKFEDAIPLLKTALEHGAIEAQRYLAEATAALGCSEVTR